MEIAKQIKLKFYGVDFPIVNLNSTNPVLESEDPIKINIAPKVYFPKETPNIFKIIQEVSLSSEGYFELFILAVGSFELDETLSEDIKQSFINTNAPAIMFPYIRAFISTLTSNVGNATGSIIIPPHFFRGEIEIVESIKLQ